MKSLIIFLLATSVISQVYAETLATVGGAKITREDFQRKMEEVRKQSLTPPSEDQFLEDLIRFEVGVQEAEKEKLQNDPAVKDQIKQILYNALLEKKLGKRIEDIKITENEMRDDYKKNPEVHLSHILIMVKEGATPAERDAARKRAQEVLDEAKKGKTPFDELARKYTEDTPTKDIGGDIGFHSRMTLAPLIYDATKSMKLGEVKGLIDTPLGFHIIRLIERRPFDSADKRLVRAVIFDEKRGKIFNEYFEKLKRQYKIEVSREAMKSLKR